MKSTQAAVALAAALSAAIAVAGPLDGMKGKMKEGEYEIKMSNEMPGMPAGMGNMTMRHCVSNKDIESGNVGKAPDKNAGDCEIKDAKWSGNTATYKTVCKNEMTADTTMTFTDNGYNMTTRMVMNQGGQKMNMTQKMDARYLGPCKK